MNKKLLRRFKFMLAALILLTSLRVFGRTPSVQPVKKPVGTTCNHTRLQVNLRDGCLTICVGKTDEQLKLLLSI